jgi:hypothetical protein
MAKMMMGQIDHARSRVHAITSELLGKAPDREKSYSVTDLVVGLRDGTVKFTGPQLTAFAKEWADQYAKETSSYNRVNFETIVLQNAFAKERAAEKARFEKENEVYQDRVRRVNDKATAVEDAIVLGDQQAALAALTDFANFKV